jgi:hypothetical protein
MPESGTGCPGLTVGFLFAIIESPNGKLEMAGAETPARPVKPSPGMPKLHNHSHERQAPA